MIPIFKNEKTWGQYNPSIPKHMSIFDTPDMPDIEYEMYKLHSLLTPVTPSKRTIRKITRLFDPEVIISYAHTYGPHMYKHELHKLPYLTIDMKEHHALMILEAIANYGGIEEWITYAQIRPKCEFNEINMMYKSHLHSSTDGVYTIYHNVSRWIEWFNLDPIPFMPIFTDIDVLAKFAKQHGIGIFLVVLAIIHFDYGVFKIQELMLKVSNYYITFKGTLNDMNEIVEAIISIVGSSWINWDKASALATHFPSERIYESLDNVFFGKVSDIMYHDFMQKNKNYDGLYERYLEIRRITEM